MQGVTYWLAQRDLHATRLRFGSRDRLEWRRRIGDAQRVKTWMETGEVLAIPKPQAARKGAKAGKNKAGKAVSKKKRR